MENNKKRTWTIFLLLFLIVCVIGLSIIYFCFYRNSQTTIKGIIVEVYEKSLGIVELNENNDLYTIGFGKNGNIGFKKGQEIAIYSNGIILSSFPAQIDKVKKIKIIKEKSDIEIPDSVLRFYRNSRDNITVSISELTKVGISFTIKDTNEIPYLYSSTYKIYKKNPETEVTQPIDTNRIIPETENSTSSYLRT